MTDLKKTPEDFKQRFFEGMSYAAAGVNVVTTDGVAGRAGVTVSAMSSVSADTPKPTLLVCINSSSASADIILENGVFCVNILRDHQAFISDTFAGRYKDKINDKFDCSDWKTGALNVPRVADGLVAFDCRIVETKKVGTHHVCFGEVEEVHIGARGSALIYANRAYGASTRINPAAIVKFDRKEAPDRLKIGCFHTFAPFIMPKLFSSLLQANPDLDVDIVEGDDRRLKESLLAGEIDLAILYAADDDAGLQQTPLFGSEPYVLLAEGHSLSAKNELTIADLEGQPMISVRDPASQDMFEGVLSKAGIKPNVVFRASSFEMARGMVGQGVGFALVMTKPASSVTYDGMSVVSRPLLQSGARGEVVLVQKPHAGANSALDLAQSLALELYGTH